MDNTKSQAVRLDPAQLADIAKRADAARRVGGSTPHKIPQGQGVKGAEAAAATKAQQRPGVVAGALKAASQSRGTVSKVKNALTRALDKAEQDSRY